MTLETIAEQTKIRAALLDGLERGDISHWPGGIFRRSYLRSYAVAIGLDPEVTVREFLALYPDGAEEAPAAVLAEAEARRSDHRPKTRLHYLLSSAIGAVSKPFDKERTAVPSPGSDAEVVAEVTTYAEATVWEAPDVVIPAISTEQTLLAAGESSIAGTSDEPVADAELDEADAELEIADAIDRPAAPLPQIDLAAMAQLCTHIVEAQSVGDLEALLGEAARVLGAIGIVVWPWDQARAVMAPSLSHGYPRRTLARLPTLAADADNPIGDAFRSSARQIVTGGGSTTGAIVLPLTTPRGCSGVLAVEYANGLEQDADIQALATILAAQLSPLVQAEPAARHAIA